MKRHEHTPAGFTLLELLVSMSVVAVLAALLLAAMPSIYQAGLRTECNAHLHTITQGLLLYAQDNEGTLPQQAVPTYHVQQGIWFGYQADILPYLGLPDISAAAVSQLFKCPLDHTFAPASPSYLFNAGNQYDPQFPGLAGTRLSAIQSPSMTVLVEEGAAIFPTSWHAPGATCKNIAGFVDGHTAFIPFYKSPGATLSVQANPPAGYGYKLSSD